MKWFNGVLAFALLVSISFLLTYAVSWFYSIYEHGFPYFIIAEPVPAIWITESFLIVFAILSTGYALIRLAKR